VLSGGASEQSGQPRVVGRYAILGKLGSGGMGVVYRANDASTGKTVALKQLLSRQAGDHRRTVEALFQREFHTLSGLRHPRIIDVYEYGHTEQGPHYTMELLSGKGLAELAPLPYKEACRHVRDAAARVPRAQAGRPL
jgi:serine/threonine protein kinase